MSGACDVSPEGARRSPRPPRLQCMRSDSFWQRAQRGAGIRSSRLVGRHDLSRGSNRLMAFRLVSRLPPLFQSPDNPVRSLVRKVAIDHENRVDSPRYPKAESQDDVAQKLNRLAAEQDGKASAPFYVATWLTFGARWISSAYLNTESSSRSR